MKIKMKFEQKTSDVNQFDSEVISYLNKEYGCTPENASMALKNAKAYDWSLCNSPKGIVGIQVNLCRNIVYVGQ